MAEYLCQTEERFRAKAITLARQADKPMPWGLALSTVLQADQVLLNFHNGRGSSLSHAS